MQSVGNCVISAIRLPVTLQPIFVSKKIEQELKPKEIKPSIVIQHCAVYKFGCDLCDADYVGYTGRHLHERIAEHKYSAIVFCEQKRKNKPITMLDLLLLQ